MKKLLTLLFCASLFLGTAYATPWYDAVVGTSAVSGVNLDFTGGVLPAGVTFSRASLGSDGSYFNSSGVLTNASANTARFDYDPVALTLKGLLTEGQRINGLYPSIPDSTWTGNASPTLYSIATNQTISPDGTTNASLLTDTSINANHGIEPPAAFTITAGTNYYISIFAKAKDQSILQMRGAFSGNFTASSYANFDLSAGAVTATGAGLIFSSISNVGNGWYRCTIGMQAIQSVSNSPFVAVNLTNNVSNAPVNPAYVGAGTGLYIWGGDVETAPSSSYIPTSGSAATRAADVLSFTIPSGVGHLTYIFDDNSTQIVAVSAGAYTVPTNLNRAWIKTIVSSP